MEREAAAKRARVLAEPSCWNTCGAEVWKDLVGHEGLKLRDKLFNGRIQHSALASR